MHGEKNDRGAPMGLGLKSILFNYYFFWGGGGELV